MYVRTNTFMDLRAKTECRCMLPRSCVHSGSSETQSRAFYSDSSSSSFSLPEHHSYALSARGDSETKETVRRITGKVVVWRSWEQRDRGGQTPRSTKRRRNSVYTVPLKSNRQLTMDIYRPAAIPTEHHHRHSHSAWFPAPRSRRRRPRLV